MSRRVLVCAACVACGRIRFDPQVFPDATTQSAGSCLDPAIDDAFTAAEPCTPWGNTFMTSNASLVEGSAQLAISFTAANANAGCITNATEQLGTGGASAEIAHAISGQDAYTAFQLGDIDRAMEVTNGILMFATKSTATIYAQTSYDPIAMRWWRMRPAAGAIVGDYSPDGATWTTLGSAPTTMLGSRVVVMAGVIDTASSDTAVFAHLVVCP